MPAAVGEGGGGWAPRSRPPRPQQLLRHGENYNGDNSFSTAVDNDNSDGDDNNDDNRDDDNGIRSTNQDDTDGTSSIILPCPLSQ